MTITSKLHRAFMAVIASLFISVSAFAQSTILVVDQGRVMTESEVGKHIERQLKSIASTMKSELKAQSPSESEASGLLAEIKSYESNPRLAASVCRVNKRNKLSKRPVLS